MILQDKLLQHFSTFLNIEQQRVTRVSDRRYYLSLRQYINAHSEQHQDFFFLEQWASLFRQELVFIIFQDLRPNILKYLQTKVKQIVVEIKELSKEKKENSEIKNKEQKKSDYENYEKIFQQINTFAEFQQKHLKIEQFLQKENREELYQKFAQSTSDLKNYLFAHLQEPCLQVSKKKYNQYNEKNYIYEIGDYFNWGVEYFAEVILKFNSKLSPNLSSYARYIISNRIIDKMRKIQRRNGHTIWSLLLRTEEKKLVEILNNWGIKGAIKEEYLRAWDYYKEIYQPAQKKISGKIQEPSEEKWKEIVKGYNSDPDSGTKVDVITLKEWLLECGKAISNFLSPEGRIISINQFIGNEEDSELEEILPSEDSLTPDTYVANQEIYDHFQEILESIYRHPDNYKPQPEKKPRTTLHPQIEQIARMAYAEEKGQVEIAERIYPPKKNLSEKQKTQQNRSNQPKIARAIKDLKMVLARELLNNYSQEIRENIEEREEQNSHNSPSPDDIANVCEVLSQWLEYYYDCQ